MALPLGVAAIVLLVQLAVLAVPHFQRSFLPRVRRFLRRRHDPPLTVIPDGYDPGRELRAEQRARALLRSCVNEEEWAMYSELGFLRVWGNIGEKPYAYLLYPHEPILAYVPQTGTLIGEYCIEFPDHTRPYGSSRLPDSDDVLAKWVALTADERSLIEQANMHLPGRQVGVAKARRDLARLASWERRSLDRHESGPRGAGNVPAL
jgi:hypothetical protein